jgi:hypothetical protein
MIGNHQLRLRHDPREIHHWHHYRIWHYPTQRYQEICEEVLSANDDIKKWKHGKMETWKNEE